jgi:hypothetical protein
MGQVLFFAFTAALNPTLLAATTVLLLLPSPKRLLLGYLLGAALTSITLGLVIVDSLQGSDAVSAAQNTVNPAADLALGLIALIVAFVLGTGRDARLKERRRERKGPKEPKGPPRWQRALGKGSAKVTFAVGAVLTLPGASYLAGLDRIAEQDLSTTETVLVVVGFNVIMLLLLELPLLGDAIAPEWTPNAVQKSRDWLNRRGRSIAVKGLVGLGVLLIARAAITVLS